MAMDLNARAERLPDNAGEDLMTQVDATLDHTLAQLNSGRMKPEEMIATAMGHVIKLAIVSAQGRIVRLPDVSAIDAVNMTAEVAAWHVGQALEALPPSLVRAALPVLVNAMGKGARDCCQCARCTAKRGAGKPH